MMDATGVTGRLAELIPPGPERDEFMGLVRLGLAFRKQQRGKRPGFLRQYLKGIVARLKAPVSFERVLDELELEAARRNLHGEEASPIESVNRIWDLVTYHHPRDGRIQTPFKTVQNLLTFCKKA